ncbi:hypothetical protein OXPF_13270 [Oxobacter pfennigii]|uniref:Uncharacterized protein n=1 Tax=Oxobacter pfennigii TaxID=36849 RepID=A0A0P8YCH0_9CLOT|nr:hypothetical protein [Oxobacter pfennigii]KPU44852.1 hypothetical protein OXPF_13270 [Oxobacter pfennigii]
MDSYEQMNAIAQQCSHFSPEGNLTGTTSDEKNINCTMCRHYNNGLCKIKDEILVNMDQT